MDAGMKTAYYLHKGCLRNVRCPFSPALCADHQGYIVQIFARAQAALALRTAFEASISPEKPADKALLAAMWAYIRFEQSKGPSARDRVRVLLERAIARFPVTVQLWVELIRHTEDSEMRGAVDAAEVEVVCYRATRNCPWNGELWAARLRALERQGKDGAAATENSEVWRKHSATYREALQVCLPARACIVTDECLLCGTEVYTFGTGHAGLPRLNPTQAS
jgi:hypothetical protein